MDNNIVRCTRCYSIFNDMRVEVELTTTVERLRDDKRWEPIQNLNLSTREVLCPECFYKFSDKLSELNLDMAGERSATDIITPPEEGCPDPEFQGEGYGDRVGDSPGDIDIDTAVANIQYKTDATPQPVTPGPQSPPERPADASPNAVHTSTIIPSK